MKKFSIASVALCALLRPAGQSCRYRMNCLALKKRQIYG